MFLSIDFQHDDWLTLAQEALADVGLAVITNAVPESVCQQSAEASQRLRQGMASDLGQDCIQENLRCRKRIEFQCPLQYDPYFFTFLELPSTRMAVQALLGPWATLRSQTFEDRQGEIPGLVQSDWHMNFRVQGEGVPAFDVIYPLTELNEETSCLEVVLGSHTRKGRPSEAYLRWAARPFFCPAGALVLMDARLWHREWAGKASTRQVLVHQLFVPHWVKPFFDFPRLLGEEAVAERDPAVRRYLGWDSRPPVSLQQFALPPAERPYRAGQWEF